MIFPLLPIFYVMLGAEKSIIGLIEGIAESTSSILKVVSGWLSDKIGKRKSLIALGYTISTSSKPLFAFAANWSQALAIRFTDRIGKGIRESPRDAIIADSSAVGVRGRAFGYHRAMDTVGAIIGPLIAILLVTILGSTEHAYRTIFLVATIPGAIAVLLVLAFVEEVKPDPIENAHPIKLSFKSFTREFKVLIFIATLFSLGNFSYAFLVLRAEELGLRIEVIFLMYFIFTAVYAIFSMPIGIVSDRIGRKPVLALGYLAFGFMCLGFAFATSQTNIIYIIAFFLMYGLSNAITETIQRTYVSELVAPELRGTAFGVFHTIIGIALLPASVIAGILWQIYGTGTITFLYGATFALAAATVLAVKFR